MGYIPLPIDYIAGSSPPRFKWFQTVATPIGDRLVANEGTLPASVEVAVIALINTAKHLRLDNAELRGMVDGLTEQVALLSKKADPPAPTPTPTPTPTTPTRKGRGQ